mmetsp:Transcript_5216/g.7348  ORF Transcript_5216/g.7348 Transcript_5216/m.7348 type:complete len:107 (-) Transcript_5216:1052-1372(-)
MFFFESKNFLTLASSIYCSSEIRSKNINYSVPLDHFDYLLVRVPDEGKRKKAWALFVVRVATSDGDIVQSEDEERAAARAAATAGKTAGSFLPPRIPIFLANELGR